MSDAKPFQFIKFTEENKKEHTEKLLKFHIKKKKFINDDFFKDKDDRLFSKWVEVEGINEKTYRERLEEYFNKKRVEFDKQIEEYFTEKKSEADKILKDAEKKAEELFKQKEKEGFEKGYREGFEKGYKEIIEKETINFENFKQILNALSKKEEEIALKFQNSIAKLIIELSKKIIKKEIEFKPEEVVFNNLKSILSKLIDSSNITVKVSPEDMNFIKEKIGELDIEKVKVIKSNELNRGDVIVETSFGTYDASIQSQLEELTNMLNIS